MPPVTKTWRVCMGLERAPILCSVQHADVGTVSLPVWLVVVLVLLAAWAALDRLLIPSVRWVLRRRVNRVLEELNTRLKIRVQPFKLTKREVLIDRLLFDPQVAEAAEAAARESDMPREVAMEQVGRYAREIVPAFNAYVYFRVGYWLARALARSLYRVRLGYSDEEGLAAIAPQSTVVFLINHRSNMDYILVSYLAAEKAALSYAVGEWARIWPLQTLIRAMGAYFVRRNSKDPLYRKVLERYVAMATAAGVTQAVFPGGRPVAGRKAAPAQARPSRLHAALLRPGRRARPRLRAGRHQLRPDVRGSQLPASISTPRPVGPARAGRSATRRASWRATSGSGARSQWHRFGYACVNFGSPVSLRDYLKRHGLDFRTLPREERSRTARGPRPRADGVGRARDPGRAGFARRDRLRARAGARAGACSS